MSLNPNTRTVYYQPVKRTYNYKYDGELIHFKNQDIDLILADFAEFLNAEKQPFLAMKYL